MTIRTSGAGVAPKCTFKVVQNCALAEWGVYVLKLIIKLRVKVPCLVSCYTTKYIVGGKREFPHYHQIHSPFENLSSQNDLLIVKNHFNPLQEDS